VTTSLYAPGNTTTKAGSGKSFFNNFLTLALQKYDPRTFIFDLGGSYEIFWF
jgi:type IV secretory pathway VirB4 component